MKIFNPLTHLMSQSSDSEESTSSLINDQMGVCPKCKQPFGSATVDGEAIYYCVPCRVSQPLPTTSV
jgi:formamidopyrimidine-DNA glycosylase